MKKNKLVCIALSAAFALSAASLAACGTTDPGPKPPLPTGDAVYPTADYLNNLYSGNALTEAGKGQNSTHDPVFVEAKAAGKSVFYAFSTDNDQFGVQIRKS